MSYLLAQTSLDFTYLANKKMIFDYKTKERKSKCKIHLGWNYAFSNNENNYVYNFIS